MRVRKELQEILTTGLLVIGAKETNLCKRMSGRQVKGGNDRSGTKTGGREKSRVKRHSMAIMGNGYQKGNKGYANLSVGVFSCRSPPIGIWREDFGERVRRSDPEGENYLKTITMAEQAHLQLQQEMQRQMLDMRAEIAALRAERENRVGEPSVQSVNVQTIHTENDEEVKGDGVHEVVRASVNRGRGGKTKDRGRGNNGRGRNRGRGSRQEQGGGGRGRGSHAEVTGPVVHVDELPPMGQPDQAKGLHPFTDNVMRAAMPENRVFPFVEKYGGLADPVKHLRSFVDAMAVYSSDKLVWCRVFSLTLKEEAIDWFHSLQPRTIDSFATLRQLFSQHSDENETRKRRILQGIYGAFQLDGQAVGALTNALRPGSLTDYIYEEEPQTMDELQNKLAGFIRIEEGRAHQGRQMKEISQSVKVGRERRGEKRPHREEGGSGSRNADVPRISQYLHHTPLNAPRARVMEEALRADLMVATRSPTPRGADESKHCKYHQNMGHTTEDCITLKDKLESLVQAGHLREFVQRKGTSSGAGTNNGNRPPRRKTENLGNPQGARDDRPLRGVFNTISGGFAGGGPSSAARKRHVRNLHSVNRAETARRSMPPITFSDEDFHAPDPNQDDPMVITPVIARYSVGKVLIDQGSSTNILYWKIFQQMDIQDGIVMPFHEQILGFAGERVDTCGYVDLKVSLGVDRGAKEIKVRFLLVDADTSYNVLLGRSCLNAFGAIVSTPHLTLKYPADDGKIWTVNADQKVARECYAAGLKVKPFAGRGPESRSEVALAELDPRVEVDNRVEPMGEVQPFQLGAEEKTTMVGVNLSLDQVERIGRLLVQNKDLFAWTASDMPGIHPDVISHKLSVFKDARPVSQKKRRLGAEKRKAVEEEVCKLLEAGFIREVKYTTWLANVVMVKKSNDKWRMCTDFTDLNKACPKDTYPLPSIDALVDGVSGYEILSFLDAYSGYNQIPMYHPDSEKTAFITERATYCYEVMPFGLKNARATYQCLMDKVYVDDVVVRSRYLEDHLRDLEEVFGQVRKYDMRLNLLKCTFGVQVDKFLGFMLTARGIEANPEKCKAILEMRSPQMVREVQRLVGRLTSLSRFIPHLAERIKPILKTMKRTAQECWNDQCEGVFGEVKKILTQPPVMGWPVSRHDLQVFLATTEEAISAALIQETPEFKLIYFVSRILKDAETRYQKLEKVVLSLVYAARRLRPYFQGHQVVVRTDYPIAKILRKPDLAGRMIGWSVELLEFGLCYEPRGSVKGQHLADFAAELPVGEDPFCWQLSVDGSSNKRGGGAGVVLEGPNEVVIEQALIFKFKVSNNQAEYEALIAGLELAKDLGVERLKCHTDSQLVEGQMNGSSQVKDSQLQRYFHRAKKLATGFSTFELRHVPRTENTRVDKLSKLASGNEKGGFSSVVRHVLIEPTIECLNIEGSSGQETWRQEIVRLIREQEEGRTLAAGDAKKIAQYCVVGEDLYRRGYVYPLLKCLVESEAEYVMRELHQGVCGRHTGGRALRARILRAGFFWPTLEKDSKMFVQKCKSCQQHGNVSHEPGAELQSLVSPWPFAQWGMDIVGPFLTGRSQMKFLLVAVDYFTKWVEAEPVAKISAAQVQKFGLPHAVITDNGRQFVDKKLVAFYKELGIKPRNGQAEAMNKIIVQELKRRLGEAKGGWVDELPQVLWGYRCSPHGATRKSPFNLTYGTDAMVPVEVGEVTLRKQMVDMERNDEGLRSNLDVLQERREIVAVRVEAQKRLVARRYNAKVRPRRFIEGDLVWRKTVEARRESAHGKFAANWKGPFRVRESLNNGAYRLEYLNGRSIPNTWNWCEVLKLVRGEVRKMTSKIPTSTQKNDFRNPQFYAGSQKNDSCLTPFGGNQKNDFRIPHFYAGSQKNDSCLKPFGGKNPHFYTGSHKNDSCLKPFGGKGSQKNDFRNPHFYAGSQKNDSCLKPFGGKSEK
ncbi:hypothetical protein V8G54_013242 [Vigna mungo]|uniref:Uncharacterized protein n=1 Tax=Vigna mungo TaxID=3915 RepID=A0AAQ3S4N3_VIGMU